MQKIKDVILDERNDECLGCGACQCECDEIFYFPEDSKDIKVSIRGTSEEFNIHKSQIKAAESICPMKIIKVIEE